MTEAEKIAFFDFVVGQIKRLRPDFTSAHLIARKNIDHHADQLDIMLSDIIRSYISLIDYKYTRNLINQIKEIEKSLDTLISEYKKNPKSFDFRCESIRISIKRALMYTEVARYDHKEENIDDFIDFVNDRFFPKSSAANSHK